MLVKEGLQLGLGGLYAIQVPLQKGVMGIRGESGTPPLGGAAAGAAAPPAGGAEGTTGGGGVTPGAPAQSPQSQPGKKSRVERRLEHLRWKPPPQARQEMGG